MAFKIRSLAFDEGAAIPRRHTCDGENLSPALEWSGAPPNTKSFALICDDPDAPVGTWNHWLLWDMAASLTGLPEGFRAGRAGTSGVNDFGNPGYGGPCPPRGHGPHRYYFKLFAMDVEKLGLKEGAKRAELDRALRGHIVGETWAMGRYERR
jgi:Raf kinase inhibitor-like YbhB/YbcL family protein